MAPRRRRAPTLAGCSSGSGGKKADEEGGSGASAGKANTPRMTVALVTHQAPGDTFSGHRPQGCRGGRAKDNIKLVYSADPNAGNQANLVQNAIDQKVDGIAVTLASRTPSAACSARPRRPAYPSSASTPDWRTGRSSA